MTTAATRALQGPHLWGRLDDRPVNRALVSTRTLVVFPPGTNTRERVLLQAWHLWPAVGAVVAVVVVAATGATATGMVAAAALYACGFGVLGRGTRRLRPLVRALGVTVFLGPGRPEVHGELRQLLLAFEVLTLAEASMRDGAITPAEFEATWAVVWRSL